MENKRLFISLPINSALGKGILKDFQQLKLPWEKMKNVELDNLHINLKFLGTVNLEKLPELLNSLEQLDTDITKLEIEINKTAIFNPRHPQTLVLNIKENKKLQKLFTDIENQLFDDGLAHKEIRKFTPHITLARVKKTTELREFKEFQDWTINKSFEVDYFELIESELGNNGPLYTTLQTFNLSTL